MRKFCREWWPLLAALAAALGVLATYAIFFLSTPIGGPSAWSEFGDYFGGMLNPIIGIITVVLVVLTLRVTRKEAEQTRQKMVEQIEQLRQQTILLDMQKRLDGVLVEWERVLGLVAPNEHQRFRPGSGHQFTNREVLEDNERHSHLVKAANAHAGPDRFADPTWNVFHHDVTPLLYELDKYCVAYERESGNNHLTDFYKARVRRALRSLSAAGIMSDSLVERLKNDRD